MVLFAKLSTSKVIRLLDIRVMNAYVTYLDTAELLFFLVPVSQGIYTENIARPPVEDVLGAGISNVYSPEVMVLAT